MNISVQKLQEMRENNESHTLLDIREAQELAMSSIEGSLNISMNSLLDNLDKLPRDEPLIVMCHIGGRSAQVVDWLIGNGYPNSLNLEGGINAWAQQIDNTVLQY